MSTSMENLTPKLEIDILKKYEMGILKIGEKIPFMHQELMVYDDSKTRPKPNFGEFEITSYLIKKLQAKYRQFTLSCEEVIQCGSIPEEAAITDRYPDYKRNMEEVAVMNIWRNNGYVVLKFEWKKDLENHFGENLFATVGKVMVK